MGSSGVVWCGADVGEERRVIVGAGPEDGEILGRVKIAHKNIDRV